MKFIVVSLFALLVSVSARPQLPGPGGATGALPGGLPGGLPGIPDFSSLLGLSGGSGLTSGQD